MQVDCLSWKEIGYFKTTILSNQKVSKADNHGIT